VAERKTRRLFVGIALDDRARSACAAVAALLARTGFAARYEGVEKLHVTLAFLGNVPVAQYDAVAAALATVAARCGRFAVRLDKLGAFPHERRPRVVYIGARDQGAQFRALAAAVRETYASLDFDFKNDAVAHVTVARVKEDPRPLPSIEFAAVPIVVERVTLFESLADNEKRTSRYEVRSTADLRG
jgi:RNA 2',3'-cyclic 3'-phosphodiesterase